MIRRYSITAAILSLALALALTARYSRADDQNQQNANQQNQLNQNQNQQDAKAQDPAAQKQRDEAFFKEAASGNTLEIQLAKLAQERASDPQVKQIAQSIEQDHTQANKNLTDIAQQQGITISQDQLTPVDQATLDAMKEKQGEAFTQCYVFQQAGAHLQNQLAYGWHANHGSQACRQYASQTLPKIQEHLQTLEQLGRSMAGLSGNAQPAAERLSPDNANSNGIGNSANNANGNNANNANPNGNK